MDQSSPTCAPTGDQTRNLGMQPDQKLHPQPSGAWNDAPTNQATGQGWVLFLCGGGSVHVHAASLTLPRVKIPSVSFYFPYHFLMKSPYTTFKNNFQVLYYHY